MLFLCPEQAGVHMSSACRWVVAKREQDFHTADAIRSELRAIGIEPDLARPSEKGMAHQQVFPSAMMTPMGMSYGMGAYDVATESKLDRPAGERGWMLTGTRRVPCRHDIC